MSSLPDLASCKKVGFIVPSSNTAVEPITNAIFLAANANIICLFTRIRVTMVGIDKKNTSQFSTHTIVEAARLLADARPDAILWNGTSGLWIGQGIDTDRALAKAMRDATGIPCSTTTLATCEALYLFKVQRIGVAVPYTEILMRKVQDFWKIAATVGIPPPESNIAIAKSELSEIRNVIESCVGQGCEAVIVACTNWPAASLVEDIEESVGIPIIDSVIVTAWQGLKMATYQGSIPRWGKLMGEFL
ncbi:hypothetical protein M433DRAFT_142827 [Acidomyces richmondensis BFW]|nr:hypothetical protein M433DRAFT_142827 [Acidomyces richmondensis BFW]